MEKFHFFGVSNSSKNIPSIYLQLYPINWHRSGSFMLTQKLQTKQQAGRRRSYIFNPAMNQKKEQEKLSNKKDSQKYTNKISMWTRFSPPKPCKFPLTTTPRVGYLLSEFSNFHKFHIQGTDQLRCYPPGDGCAFRMIHGSFGFPILPMGKPLHGIRLPTKNSWTNYTITSKSCRCFDGQPGQKMTK